MGSREDDRSFLVSGNSAGSGRRHKAGVDHLERNATMQLSEGQLLADRYELRRRLGAGGAGAVFAAYDRQQSKEVAVKVLWPEFFEADGDETRFRDEIELAASLNHPGIVQVFEAESEGAAHFVAMELLEGGTLRQRMDALAGAGQGFTVDEVVHVGVALTEALGYAHQKMVHGAVKPENIFLGDDGTVTLTDFGMALLRQVRGTKRTGTSLDIAPYLAPEQLRGAQEVDPSADQYATAAVLYEMLTGEVPAGRWKDIVLFRSKRNKDLIGLTFEEIGKRRNADPYDAVFDILLEEGRDLQGVMWASHGFSESDIRLCIKQAACGVISDTMALAPYGELKDSIGSLSGYGWLARFFQKYVREEAIIGLEDAVHKVTGLPASRLGLSDRGHLHPGAMADIVVFDLARVENRATLMTPTRYPAGIGYVLVNGKIVMDSGHRTAVNSGRVIRRTHR